MDDAQTPRSREVTSGVELSPHLLALGPAAVAQVVQRFLTHLADIEEEMRRAVESGDAAALEHAAHSLKGGSGTLGAGLLRQICSRLEKIGEGGSVDGAETGLDELRREVRRIRRQLDRHLAGRE